MNIYLKNDRNKKDIRKENKKEINSFSVEKKNILSNQINNFQNILKKI